MKNGLFTSMEDGYFAISIDLVTGEEIDTVVSAVVKRLCDISEQLSVLQEKYGDSMQNSFPDDLKEFVSKEKWIFAKTMPVWPHEYLVSERVDEELFEQLIIHIRINGYEGRFYSRKITYYDEGGLVYWTMGAPLDETTIINRCRKEDSYEYRFKHGALPK